MILEVHLPSGKRWFADASGAPIRDAEGKVIAGVAVCVDVTERKQVEEALKSAQLLLKAHAANLEEEVAQRTVKLQETIGELEHFSYTITHDMRAPLRAMQGFAELLLGECVSLAPEQRDYLERIMHASIRMDALITDALQYSRIIGAQIPLAPIHPAPLLRGIIESYPLFQSPNVEIVLEEPLPHLMANEAFLNQCFSNLLTNAVKFVGPGVKPRVRIWAERGTRVVRLWFEDNGIGIKPEHHARIFGMFQRLSRNYEGTGVGLALVRKAAERMGGRAGLESELGKGSRFWLEFQLA
jgi:signal transduction histidine kinase